MKESYPIKQTLCRRAASKNIPISGAFELTPRCSLNCKMCYIRMTPEQMKPMGRERSAEEWIRIAREARDMGLTFLLLTGGEPFLRTDIFEILKELNALGIVVDINSNGTLINETVVERLLQAPPAKVNITLYGASRETYESLCGDGSAFDRVVQGIDLLRSAGILVCLNATLTPDNAHETEALAHFAKSRGLVLRTTGYVIPPSRRGGPEKAYRLPAGEAGKLSFRSQLLYFGEEEMKKRAQSQPVWEDCYHEAGEGITCLAGRAQFWITWNGEMLPCGMLPGMGRSLSEESFSEAWEKINHEVRHIPGCTECANCAYRKLCPSCAASRYCETGEIHKICSYMCEFTKAYWRELEALASES